MTEIVAATIIELAQRGFKNPTALYFAAIKEFKSSPHQPSESGVEVPRENGATL